MLSQEQRAEKMFKAKYGLENAIDKQIYPCIKRIETDCTFGLGFFQHEQWLVSNAHLIPNPETLDKTYLIDDKAQHAQIEVERSFHRPFGEKMPDIVILKTKTSSQALCVNFTWDEAHPEHYLFYVTVNPFAQSKAVKFLKQMSNLGALPLQYQCLDEIPPQPGDSGAPIIEARVLIRRNPVWQFRVVGVLYARSAGLEVSQDQRLVCAIPIVPDFLQLLPGLQKEESSQRYQQMAEASKLLKDEQSAVYYQTASKSEKKEAKICFAEFERGKTDLPISLPLGLEPLLGDKIVSLEDSFLIPEVRKKLSRNKEYQNVKSATKEELEKDFKALLNQIKNWSETIPLTKRDSFFESKDGFFRVDVGPGGKGKDIYWLFNVQDNTGKFKVASKSASSVFAVVKVTGKNELNGNDLIHLSNRLQESQANKKTIELSLSPKKEEQKPQKFSYKKDNQSFYSKSEKRKEVLTKKEAIDSIRNLINETVYEINPEGTEVVLYFTNLALKMKFITLLDTAERSKSITFNTEDTSVEITKEAFDIFHQEGQQLEFH